MRLTARNHVAADTRAGASEFARGWPALLACSLGIGLGMSPLFTFTSGVFAVPLQHEFGWGRGDVLGASIFDMLAVLFVSPIVGRLIDRVGPRPVAIVSTFAIGATTIALSTIGSQIWTYYALYALRSAVSVGTLPPTFAKVVNSRFVEKRGLALGIALCTTGAAGIVLPVYVQSLISAFGWRWAFVGLGLLPLLVAWPCILLFLPGDIAAKAKGKPQAAADLIGLSVRDAMSGYRFWLLAALTGAAGVGLGGILINLVPMLVDRGFTPAVAASMMSLYGLTIIFGRLFSGWLLDRFWGPGVGFVFLVTPCLGALMLASGVDAVPTVALAVVLVALASGAEFDLVAFLTARYFGQRNFSTLYSIEYACFGLGAGASPALFGFAHDRMGDYTVVLFMTAGLFACCAGAILMLGRYPRLSDGDRLGVA